MKKLFVLCLLVVWALPASAADSKSDAGAWGKALAPYLDENTFAVVRADLAKLAEEGSLQKVGELARVPQTEMAIVKLVLLPWLQSLNKAGGKDLFVVVSMNDLPHDLPFVVLPLEPGADVDTLQKILKLGAPFKSNINKNQDGHAYGIPAVSDMVFEKIGSALVGGTPDTLKRLRMLKPTPRPEVERALAAVGSSAVQAIFVPPAHARRLIEETTPTVPPPVSLPSSHFTRGVLWASLGLDLTPTASARFVIQSQDAAAAKNFADLVVSVKKALGQWPEFLESLPGYPRLAELLTPKVEGERLTLTLDEPGLIATLQPIVWKSLAEVQSARTLANLREIGIAMHNYHDIKKNFPAWASYDKEGKKPLLSWRVHLLPFLGQEPLYKEFHLDEPWDSDHNKMLIPRMPAVYRSPAYLGKEIGKTTFLVPLGEQMAFQLENKGARLSEFTDGTSNTILAVDADDDRAVIWTQPGDLKVDQNKPSAGLGNRASGKFGVLTADGSAHSFPRTVAPGNLWAWFTRSGGEVVILP